MRTFRMVNAEAGKCFRLEFAARPQGLLVRRPGFFKQGENSLSSCRKLMAFLYGWGVRGFWA